LNRVVQKVESLSTEWLHLSSNLGLKHTTQKVISYEKHDAYSCLYAVMEHWLNKNYDFDKHGQPSWRRLAVAVENLNYTVFESIMQLHHM